MKRNYASVKLTEETYKILQKVKEETGVPITEAIRIAVRRIYGKEN